MTTRTIARTAGALLATAALLGSVAACTKSSGGGHVGVTTQTQTITTTPAGGPTGPVRTGKLVEKKAGSCPLVSTDEAKDDVGMRLNKVATVTQDGVFAGCRFYPAVFQSEHLPPPSQVVVEILVSEYASARAAHNAFITIAEKAGTNFQQAEIATGNTGVCYQTTLWPDDKGKDWACNFSKGAKVVVIRTVVTSPALNVIQLAKAVYPKV